jgi:hypothetical protein
VPLRRVDLERLMPERIRARIDSVGELDLASQNVLIEVVPAVELQLWTLRVKLPTEGEH